MAPSPRRFQLPIFSDAAAITSMYDMLFHAAYDGDLRHFKRLVRALDKGRGRLREAVEAARLDGVGALHVAAMAGSLEVCSYMVEGLRVGVDPVDDEGRTPLFCAIEGENVEVVKYLLDHGANQDKADHEGQTPLHSAAAIGDCVMVELLIAKGAYVDPVAVGGTPLHVAATKGQDSTMKILLEHNADCNKMDMIFGVTPLFAAINVGSVKCVKLLVEAGADINEDCMFSAFFESINGHDVSSECLNFLLETTAAGVNHKTPNDAEHANKGKIAKLKSLGSEAVERKDYPSASEFYTKDRAREEVMAVFGRDTPDYQGLAKLKIVTMILYEVLRLYPSSTINTRKTCKEVEIGAVRYPAGVIIELPVLLIHHDQELWGSDAHEFRPERFAEGISKASKVPGAFLPFGWGPRICIGQSFALLEAKMALCMIHRRFEFELAPSYTHVPRTMVTLHPMHGAPIKLRAI